jgi:hypothetical protein
MTSKKEQQYKAIQEHGIKLKRLFGLDDIDPIALCKKLHRIEVKESRHNVDLCNGAIDPTDEQLDKHTESVLKAIDKITGFRAKGIPVIINGDPRGYALKIDDAYMVEHNVDLHRDMGGYGILAPEF